MLKKIKTYVFVVAAALALGAPALVPAVSASAIDNKITQGLCTGVNNAADSSGSTDCSSGSGNDALKKIAGQLVNIFSIIVGIAAVIMIIFGGFKYITSGGDSNNVSGAKNTLIYAIIGLIVVALAQFIVHYVLSTAQSVT